ncbi:MAG: ATPase, T2SS/T4P/T4SS family [Chloroflexota bacterium]
MDKNELIRALGPLAKLYQDETVQAIIVDGPNQVYFERENHLHDSEINFKTTDALSQLISDVLTLAGVTLTANAPSADVRLTGNTRFLATMPPTAVGGPFLVVRKPFLGTRLTWEDLVEFGSVNQKIIELIQSALDARINILITGGTASGKTTLLNMIAGRVSNTERIVGIEDIHYLNIDHPRAVYLESQAAGVPMPTLIETGSRMRPDWLIVNELRGPEALTTLQIFNSGHSGMASMHAASVADGLSRLETMCLSANRGLGLQDIQRMISSTFQLIVYIEYLPSGKRRVTEMVEMQGLENNRYLLQPLIRYNREKDNFETTNTAPTWRK